MVLLPAVREPEQWHREQRVVLREREQRLDERELEHRFPAFQVCQIVILHQIIRAAAKIDSYAAGLVGKRTPGTGKEGISNAKEL